MLLSVDDTDLPVLVERYEKTLTETLESHATLCPLAPWYHDGISDAKRKRRKLEHHWPRSRLCVDMEIYFEQCQIVNQMLRGKKIVLLLFNIGKFVRPQGAF